ELFVWFSISLGIMSLVDHKEPRFIFSLYPIMIILFAATLILCFEGLTTIYQSLHLSVLPIFNVKRKMKQRELLVIQIVVMLLLCTFISLTSVVESTTENWMFNHDLNKALEWIGQQEDSTGVIVLVRWADTGGWTYLHKQIPMGFFSNPDMPDINNLTWKDLSPTYNYLVTAQDQYLLHDELKGEIADRFTLLRTVDNRIDIWHLNSVR
ncbi:MAG: hypothetical protein ACFFBD_08910, partial [Candidatus Hodarchaeota archaeon]